MSLASQTLLGFQRLATEIKTVRAEMAALGGGGGGATWPTAVQGVAVSQSTITGAAAPGCSASLTPGTYRITGLIVWQSATATTGISLFVRGSGGTVTRNVGHWYHLTTGGAATTGISDQHTSGTTTGQMIEGRAWRANNIDPGAVLGVDTINADELAMIECILTVTATTTCELVYRSEVAGTSVSIMPGSHLKFEKVI